MRFPASILFAVALIALALPATPQDQAAPPCVKETLEAAAAQSILHWMNESVVWEERMQEAYAESRRSSELDDWQRRFLDDSFRSPERLRAKLDAFRNLQEHARAVHEWKLGVKRECLVPAEGATDRNAVVRLQEAADHVVNFKPRGEFRFAPDR